MFRLSHVLQVKEGEYPALIVRRHPVTMASSLVLAALCIVTPFFFLFSLAAWGSWGIILFACCLALGIYLALRTFLLWDGDVFVVTSTRLVEVQQRGLWHRVVREASLREVQELGHERAGFRDWMMRTGTLRVWVSGHGQPWHISRLTHPESIVNRIQELREPGQPPSPSVASVPLPIIERISALLQDASPDILANIEKQLLASRASDVESKQSPQQ